MNQHQEKLLGIIKFFHEFCVENNLRYYVTGGSLLGAMRHEGFIPWDDDIDVAMPRPDYEKLRELLEGKQGRYILETPYSKAKDYGYTMSKIYDSETTAVEKVKFNTCRGVFLDVFPLDGIGNTKDEMVRNHKKIYWLNMFIATRTSIPRAERSWYKNVAILVSSIIPEKLLNTKRIICKLDKMCARIPYDNSKYVGNLAGAYGLREIVDRDLFGEPKLYKFEDTYVYGVEKGDEYLTQIYGDWRQLPPEDKRSSGHDFELLDLNRSYIER